MWVQFLPGTPRLGYLSLHSLVKQIVKGFIGENGLIKPYWSKMLSTIFGSLLVSWIAFTLFPDPPLWLGMVCVLPGMCAFCYLLSYVIQQINKGEGL